MHGSSFTLVQAHRLGSAVRALCVCPCSAQPAAHATPHAQEAAAAGAQLVVLPEMWNCPYSNDSFPSYAEDVDAGASPSADALSAAAADNGVTLVGGSIPERSAGRLFNTCLVYSSQGRLLAKHRKARRSSLCLVACAAHHVHKESQPRDIRSIQLHPSMPVLPSVLCWHLRQQQFHHLGEWVACRVFITMVEGNH